MSNGLTHYVSINIAHFYPVIHSYIVIAKYVNTELFEGSGCFLDSRSNSIRFKKKIIHSALFKDFKEKLPEGLIILAIGSIAVLGFGCCRPYFKRRFSWQSST